MSGDVAPSTDAWVAAVHASEDDDAPLGAAVVIDERRLLTCSHVAGALEGTLWVAFPKADDAFGPRRRVGEVRVAGPKLADLAVLELDEPVPLGVASAPLRCPKPADVVSLRWWAFGFAGRDPLGNCADGVVGAALGYGWVRLDAESRYHVEPGFSGCGLWSPDYGAVIGVVGAANDRGDGRAIMLHQADLCLPEEKLRDLTEWTVATAGEMALSAWGWTLETDDEARRHWRPRARGVSVDSERGYRFRGRRAALTEIVTWLDRERPDRKVLIVTGSPGVGKSAVLGRVVTTADAGVAAVLPADDDAVRATVGAVACAVHAKGKTALDVAMEIARAASAPLAERLDDLLPGLRDVLAERGRRFNVVVDALDEAANPAEARAIITRVVLPIAETCADVGAQVVVGTRRSDATGDLLWRFGPARAEIDLDQPAYFSIEDLTAYALATLQLRGDERPGNPYAAGDVAQPVASWIAALAGQNFLVAGLIARDHGLHDNVAVDPGEVTFTGTVDAALGRYLDRVSGVDDVPAADVLTALAFAEAPGLTAELWQAGVQALHGRAVPADRLARFARGPAANFLVESAGEGARSTYRLFHQALGDALVRARADTVVAVDDERALTRAFHAYGARVGWDTAPAYVFRSLPGHAVRAGVVDELLADDEYLLYADLRRLTPAAARAATPAGRRRARLLHLTPQAIAADPADRAALLSVTEALEGLGSAYRDRPPRLPYRARWGAVAPRAERAVLEGHTGGVWAVCPVTVDGQGMLASAGDDGTVRIWDTATGEQRRALEGRSGGVWAVCPVTVDGQVLLAGAGADGAVRIWDPATGEQRALLEGRTGWVWAVCPVTVDGQVLLASAGADGAVRIWDPATGEQRAVLEGRTGGVWAVCPVTVDGQVLLASAGADGAVRIWDPATGEQRAVLEGRTGWVWAVCPVTVDGQVLLAGAGADGAVRIWDPATWEQRAVLEGHTGGVWAVCPVTVDGQVLLASAGDDGAARIWDTATGEQRAVLEGRTGGVRAVCPVTVDGRGMLVSAGADRTVRVWDLATGEQRAVLQGHTVWGVRAVCPVTVEGQTLLASAGADGAVRIWDPATGEQRRALEGRTGGVRAVCPVTVDGQVLLAGAGADGAVRIWDPATGEQRRALEGHPGGVRAVCPVTVDGRGMLASAGADGAVRIWDPATGEQRAVLEGRTGGVRAVCPVTVDGQVLLAGAGADGAVRIWDPATGEQR
ncbi:MAG: trypsin-like peptidase domain-containing protein, partial [Egibacteraceae bacterium]